MIALNHQQATERRTAGRRARRTPRGQSLIVAVVVLFVLLFIGGIFVGLIARNLSNSGRAKDTIRALQLAEAGIRYCDLNLMNSPEGADWRPAPTQMVNAQDPDQLWLQTGDWTRVTLEQGRALVRVTYLPAFITDPSDPLGQRKILDPLSRRIKIEAIGRPGFLDDKDPTTFLNTPSPRLRRELVAYKSIGITDYLFYVTNRFNDTKASFDLGVGAVGVPLPQGYAGASYPLGIQLGGLPQRTFGAASGQYYLPGAPIFVNGNVNIHGNTKIVADPRNSEGFFVAGNIKVTPNDAGNVPVFLNPATGATGPILESGNSAYSTYGGALRDGSPNPDALGYARSVTTLQPPLIDYIDPSTNQTRARMATRNSGHLLNGVNTGLYGMGEGLYIDNFKRVQDENSLSSDLRTVWLNPYADAPGTSGKWDGPYFIAKGAFLDFGYPVVQARDATTSELIPDKFVATPGIRITREDNNYFRDPAGRYSSTAEVDFTYFIYKPIGRRPVIKLESEFHRSALRGAPFNMVEKDIDRFLPEFNGVILTEGNARVRGLLPSKLNIPIRRESSSEPNSPTDTQIYQLINSPAVTIVSNDNIYIEGSLVRESVDSMIALLAQNYVVLNTTMFMKVDGAPDFLSQPADTRGEPHQYHEISPTSAGQPRLYTLDWLYADDPTLYVDTSGASMSQSLMLFHGVQGSSGGAQTYLNLFVNDWKARPPAPNYMFRPRNLPTDPGDYYEIRTDGSDNLFRKDVFPLTPKPNGSEYLFTGDAGYTYLQGWRDSFRLAVDQNFTQSAGAQPYLFSRAQVVPADARVEALIYAQNGSFFIIPGIPFNDDPSDTPEAALARGVQANKPAGTMIRPPGVSHMVPFYRQPVDCRITIVGAIAQNRTASIGDQAAWMQLWGYIPEVYGSTGKNSDTTDPNYSPTELLIPRQHQRVDEVGLNSADQRTNDEKAARITRGIRYLYDPALVTPYEGYNPTGRAFRRDDAYFDSATNGLKAGHSDVGRALPPLPRLPVCPGFVYYGEVR